MSLRKWRKRKGLTQKELAESCGTSHVRISMIERGDGLPSPKLAGKIELVTEGQVTAAMLLGLNTATRTIQEESREFDHKLATEAIKLGLNPDAIAKKAVEDAVRRKRIDTWIEENREAMEANTKEIHENGLWSDGLRTF